LRARKGINGHKIPCPPIEPNLLHARGRAPAPDEAQGILLAPKNEPPTAQCD
jgi:hypothetical protein